jgi:hypothetical protein
VKQVDNYHVRGLELADDDETNGLAAVDPVSPPRSWRHRHRWLLIGSACVLVVALAAGLTIWLVRPAGESDRTPFERAVANLAAAPAVRYGTSLLGVRLDATVTSDGGVLGTFTIAGQRFGLLGIGGRNYLKAPTGSLPGLPGSTASGVVKDRWVTGGAGLFGTASQQLLSPPALARRLFNALDGTRDLPRATKPNGQVNGVSALKASTPAGDLYVAASPPYRVLRLVPPAPLAGLPSLPRLPSLPSLPSGRGVPSLPGLPSLPGKLRSAVTAVLAAGDLHLFWELPRAPTPPAPAGAAESQLDLTSLTPAEVDQAYSDLSSNTKQLSSAVDTSAQFAIQGNAQLSCGPAGCSVTATVRNELTATGGSKVVGAQVSAELSATVFINGEPAGGCVSPPTPVTANGTAELSCVDPEAGAVFSAVQAEEQAAAARGGGVISITSTGEAEVYATAVAQVEVDRQVQHIDQDRTQAAASACGMSAGRASCSGTLSPSDDLARYRGTQGMPPVGSAADKHTAARLDAGGQSFYGRNAHNRPIDIRVNAQTKTHAEADVFQQAKNAGITADTATLFVDRDLCDSCGDYGGVGSLLRGTGIKQVVVVSPSGRFLITADRPSVPVPID